MREDRKRLFLFLIRKRGISQLQFILTSLKHINSNIRLYMLSAGARVYRHSTIGIYNSNEFYLSNDNSTIAQNFWFGQGAGWLPMAGDWDGNGTSTIGIYNGGHFYLSNDNVTVAQNFWFGGTSGWQPIVGDWDGDGIQSIGITLNGEWYLTNDNANVASHFWFGGGTGLTALAGNWAAAICNSAP